MYLINNYLFTRHLSWWGGYIKEYSKNMMKILPLLSLQPSGEEREQ